MIKKAISVWFLTTLLGQWVFIIYLLFYYIFPAIQKGLVAWSGNQLVTGYVANDSVGNYAVATHIFISVLILGFGPLQLVPKIRNQFPIFHRWAGRIYLFAVVITSLAGLYMVWVRGNPQAGLIEHIGTTLGGVLIIIFSILTYHYARIHQISIHSLWALRLFMVASGVWYIRLGYGWFYFMDFPSSLVKAFSIFISYANYLVPLVFLECYFFTRRKPQKLLKYPVALLILLFTIFTMLGTIFATKYIWLPKFNL
ncbi:hypothetical protein ATO12_20350 [Aquimarina atlantica]|uniref:DUF2306 domain-containing protein n=1 Tax=Aquimarina atlantica TaxID=1317122 RepID=A0A023BTT4_9FLAO|nr:DUF2306 domain-containing protein [Aquimarina atlantica]EZH73354.1 hypothetical protein ATO12_20350 [Aquimarina atlantica]